MRYFPRNAMSLEELLDRVGEYALYDSLSHFDICTKRRSAQELEDIIAMAAGSMVANDTELMNLTKKILDELGCTDSEEPEGGDHHDDSSLRGEEDEEGALLTQEVFFDRFHQCVERVDRETAVCKDKDVIAFFGASGSGKTTMLHCLQGTPLRRVPSCHHSPPVEVIDVDDSNGEGLRGGVGEHYILHDSRRHHAPIIVPAARCEGRDDDGDDTFFVDCSASKGRGDDDCTYHNQLCDQLHAIRGANLPQDVEDLLVLLKDGADQRAVLTLISPISRSCPAALVELENKSEQELLGLSRTAVLATSETWYPPQLKAIMQQSATTLSVLTASLPSGDHHHHRHGQKEMHAFVANPLGGSSYRQAVWNILDSMTCVWSPSKTFSCTLPNTLMVFLDECVGNLIGSMRDEVTEAATSSRETFSRGLMNAAKLLFLTSVFTDLLKDEHLCCSSALRFCNVTECITDSIVSHRDGVQQAIDDRNDTEVKRTLATLEDVRAAIGAISTEDGGLLQRLATHVVDALPSRIDGGRFDRDSFIPQFAECFGKFEEQLLRCKSQDQAKSLCEPVKRLFACEQVFDYSHDVSPSIKFMKQLDARLRDEVVTFALNEPIECVRRCHVGDAILAQLDSMCKHAGVNAVGCCVAVALSFLRTIVDGAATLVESEFYGDCERPRRILQAERSWRIMNLRLMDDASSSSGGMVLFRSDSYSLTTDILSLERLVFSIARYKHQEVMGKVVGYAFKQGEWNGSCDADRFAAFVSCFIALASHTYKSSRVQLTLLLDSAMRSGKWLRRRFSAFFNEAEFCFFLVIFQASLQSRDLVLSEVDIAVVSAQTRLITRIRADWASVLRDEKCLALFDREQQLSATATCSSGDEFMGVITAELNAVLQPIALAITKKHTVTSNNIGHCDEDSDELIKGMGAIATILRTTNAEHSSPFLGPILDAIKELEMFIATKHSNLISIIDKDKRALEEVDRDVSSLLSLMDRYQRVRVRSSWSNDMMEVRRSIEDIREKTDRRIEYVLQTVQLSSDVNEISELLRSSSRGDDGGAGEGGVDDDAHQYVLPKWRKDLTNHLRRRVRDLALRIQSQAEVSLFACRDIELLSSFLTNPRTASEIGASVIHAGQGALAAVDERQRYFIFQVKRYIKDGADVDLDGVLKSLLSLQHLPNGIEQMLLVLKNSDTWLALGEKTVEVDCRFFITVIHFPESAQSLTTYRDALSNALSILTIRMMEEPSAAAAAKELLCGYATKVKSFSPELHHEIFHWRASGGDQSDHDSMPTQHPFVFEDILLRASAFERSLSEEDASSLVGLPSTASMAALRGTIGRIEAFTTCMQELNNAENFDDPLSVSSMVIPNVARAIETLSQTAAPALLCNTVVSKVKSILDTKNATKGAYARLIQSQLVTQLNPLLLQHNQPPLPFALPSESQFREEFADHFRTLASQSDVDTLVRVYLQWMPDAELAQSDFAEYLRFSL